MMKNVTLLPEEKDGQRSWKLLGPDGSRIAAFDTFAKSLLRNCALHTRIAYCRQVAFFLDYLLEAATVLGHAGETLTHSILEEIIEAYDDYLVLGGASGKRIARLVDANTPSPKNSGSTSAQAHAAIRRFLKLSERVRREFSELSDAQIKNTAVDPKHLFLGFERSQPIDGAQRRGLMQHSVIAGVIAGGPKLMENAVLSTAAVDVTYDASRAFPFDKIADFISCLPCYRDKSAYALMAASGCRGHEGRQLLFDDIDVATGKVLLINPASRRNHSSYLHLSPLEREMLSWKGRTTNETLLIEPFATMFFENLEQYLKREYIPHGLHRFVFQSSYRNCHGRPYFLSDAGGRQDVFKKAAEKAGIEVQLRGGHSLRHAYGTYTLNYFPRMNGEYGLPLAFVQQLMGHKNSRNTSVYARYDKDLLQEEFRYANAMVFESGIPKSEIELKLEAVNALARQLEARLIALRGSGD